jgi:hypothetical protein
MSFVATLTEGLFLSCKSKLNLNPLKRRVGIKINKEPKNKNTFTVNNTFKTLTMSTCQ